MTSPVGTHRVRRPAEINDHGRLRTFTPGQILNDRTEHHELIAAGIRGNWLEPIPAPKPAKRKAKPAAPKNRAKPAAPRNRAAPAEPAEPTEADEPQE